MREAEFYSINKDGRIQCNLCPHYCILSEGIESRCQSRKVIDGKLFATNYGETISLSIDPIEKKPLYHFY
ncbi:MAG: AmmeMemoRadiSam system radical SAM enzyme, partial [Candidatus Cloacimonadota bacterium]|nr:AmmeMemoRadiSam system radical SAM enzyme [Candidatus Cloacimonadota bacterium]